MVPKTTLILVLLVCACSPLRGDDELEGSSAIATPATVVSPANPVGRRGSGKGPGGQTRLYNAEAVVPPMCYTRTLGRHNPCYVCHQNAPVGAGRTNQVNDGYLQGDYNFSDTALRNHWTNLFVDRREAVAKIPDDEARRYIDDDNFAALATTLDALGWRGYVPRLRDLHLGAAAFDAEGFAKDGSGWVAFNYKPMPGAFWPTNGATDDVMIRLPEKFRRRADGRPSQTVYRANLSIVEAAIKNLDRITVNGVDEGELGVDVNGDSVFGVVGSIVRPKAYVGGARDVEVEPWLYPQGTEFLHTVRYIAVDDRGGIGPSPRMKEVRYMVKNRSYDRATLGAFYDDERQEKIEGMLPYYADFADMGIDNGMGWRVQGYIEDARGELRPQSYEEGLYCMGCHTNVGSTIDQTFAFPRKVTGSEGWGYVNLRGMKDAPNVGETRGEIAAYLERVGGGSEFRSNDEMAHKWLDADAKLATDRLATAEDVYELLAPTPARATVLNKAYMVLVREQSFVRGRDPTVTPMDNVFDRLDPDKAPVLPAERQFAWDIRLAW